VQDPAAAIGTLGFDEAEAAKKRGGLSKHQRTAADLWGLIRNSFLDFVSNLLLGTILINRNQPRHAASSVPHRRTRDVQLGKLIMD
jgi:hypothetical protein